MGKKTKCPHDSVCPFKEMAAPDSGIYNYTSEARPLFDRVFRRGRQYQQVVQAPAPWTAYPQMPTQSRGQHAGALNTGESVYRTLDLIADDMVPAKIAMRGAAFITGLAFSVAGLIKWHSPLSTPFWIAGIAFCAIGGTLYIFISRKAILQDSDFFKMHTRDAETAQTESVLGKYKASGEIKEGQKTIYTEFDIADPMTWHNFCIDVHSGKNFSLRVARDNGVNDAEFYRIVELWKSQDPQRALINPVTVGPRKTIKLTRMGDRMVKLFAEHPPTPDE